MSTKLLTNAAIDIIGKIIQDLDSTKGYGHDNVTIRKLKICGDSVCVPLEMTFKQAFLTGLFPSE